MVCLIAWVHLVWHLRDIEDTCVQETAVTHTLLSPPCLCTMIICHCQQPCSAYITTGLQPRGRRVSWQVPEQIFDKALLRRGSTNLVGNGDRHAGVCPDDGTHWVHPLHGANHKLAAAHRADLNAVTNHKRARNELQCTAIVIFIPQHREERRRLLAMSED